MSGTYTNLMNLQRPQPKVEASQPSMPTQAERSSVGEQKARLQESKIAGKQEILQEGNLASKKARLQDAVKFYLALKNTKNTNFRYPVELVERLEDVEYQMRKHSGKRVKKTDLAISAIAYLIWDYEQRGEGSELYRILIEF